MARTPSTMVELGTPLPAFSLPDTVTHRTYQDSQFLGKPLVVAFICNHCPYVQLIEAELMNIARSYGARGISFLAISSNDPV
ncbi:MAG TPA: redoxin domain-containing protein, partial [Bacteroidia bacterium]|nr:redoxin domain-containing protein [Bacteroidia bacterium]